MIAGIVYLCFASKFSKQIFYPHRKLYAVACRLNFSLLADFQMFFLQHADLVFYNNNNKNFNLGHTMVALAALCLSLLNLPLLDQRKIFGSGQRIPSEHIGTTKKDVKNRQKRTSMSTHKRKKRRFMIEGIYLDPNSYLSREENNELLLCQSMVEYFNFQNKEFRFIMLLKKTGHTHFEYCLVVLLYYSFPLLYRAITSAYVLVFLPEFLKALDKILMLSYFKFFIFKGDLEFEYFFGITHFVHLSKNLCPHILIYHKLHIYKIFLRNLKGFSIYEINGNKTHVLDAGRSVFLETLTNSNQIAHSGDRSGLLLDMHAAHLLFTKSITTVQRYNMTTKGFMFFN
ncbi:hypothetical protein ACJX0J_010633 [Zea mays]